jgi:hypothetical protein
VIDPQHSTTSQSFAPLVIPAITSLVSLFSGLFGGHKQKQASQKASQGARLQDILPLIMPMLQQQQQHMQSNYDMRNANYQKAQPLQDAVARMAYNLMPTSAQGMGPQPYGPPKTGGQ